MFFITLIWFRNVYKISNSCWFCILFWIKWELWKTFDTKMIGWTHFKSKSQTFPNFFADRIWRNSKNTNKNCKTFLTCQKIGENQWKFEICSLFFRNHVVSSLQIVWHWSLEFNEILYLGIGSHCWCFSLEKMTRLTISSSFGWRILRSIKWKVIVEIII